MTEWPDLDAKLYAVSDTKRVSMRELLSSFKRHGVARVTDLHFKIGSPPVYRGDGHLKRTNGKPVDLATAMAISALFGASPTRISNCLRASG